MIQIQELKKSALKEISAAGDLEELGKAKIKYLGRKSELTLVLRSLKDLPLEERRKIGPLAHNFKKELEELFNKKTEELKTKISNQKPALDITKPGKKIKIGHLHPLSKTEEEIRQIFLSLNFSVVEGPEIESEYYNFDALNIPSDHPARDAWNTFWIKYNPNLRIYPNAPKKENNKLLLRTHTSPMQIYYMETHNPPFQIIVPGRVFRYEATDVSHEINFYQIEGLMVGKDISLANFKFVIEEFFKKFFASTSSARGGKEIEFRYRPSYFPFVEPGVEVDIKFKNKWLEVMGAGMVQRKVFERVKYNPYEWQGFAFGMSLERLTMIKYGIPDIRFFYSNDLRFIEQF